MHIAAVITPLLALLLAATALPVAEDRPSTLMGHPVSTATAPGSRATDSYFQSSAKAQEPGSTARVGLRTRQDRFFARLNTPLLQKVPLSQSSAPLRAEYPDITQSNDNLSKIPSTGEAQGLPMDLSLSDARLGTPAQGKAPFKT